MNQNLFNMINIDKYKYCNHHHELTNDHSIVDFGTGEFVANKAAIPLLKALNESGLITRTHHMSEEGNFISIILEKDVQIEIKQIDELNSDRTKFNGKTELLLRWGG